MKALNVFLILTITSVSVADIVYIDDGEVHTISDYRDDSIRLDFTIANEPGTHVNLIEGGSINDCFLYNNSSATIDGGIIETELRVHGNGFFAIESGAMESLLVSDNASAIINGGTINSFTASNNATTTINDGTLNSLTSISFGMININGGSFLWDVGVGLNGNIMITGGSFGRYLNVNQEGMIYLDGIGFEVNGQALSYGDKVSAFATYTPGTIGYYSGVITGTLSDGSLLNNQFQIYGDYGATGDIVIVPEPVTVMLLGLGGLIIRQKKQ